MRLNKDKGFSLIELLVVVLIIGILSAVAVPAYTGYVLRGKLTEAFSEMSAMRVRLEQFYQDNRGYGSTAAACGVAVSVPPAVKYFTYTCNWGAGATNQTYTITATGIAAQGTGTFGYTVDQSNTKATTQVPAGWNQPNPNNCWVTKPDGVC